MSVNQEESSSDIQLTKVDNLFLILLKFRFPPINLIQQAPQISTYIPIHADSLLLFADVIREYRNTDWRFDFVKISYFRKFDKDYPESLNLSMEYRVTLSSVIIPVIKRTRRTLRLFLPTRFPYILNISLRKNEAYLRGLKKADILFPEEKLWIRKRDDISKLALINFDSYYVNELKSTISNSFGGYIAIEVIFKIPLEYMSTQLAFFASIKNLELFQEKLRILKKNGVGKKRDMGFGDLLSWEIYKVNHGNKNLNIRDPMVIYKKEKSTIKLITLRNSPASMLNTLRELEKKKNKIIFKFLPINMKLVLSRTKPPYWLKQELVLMPFSEFLIRIKKKRKNTSKTKNRKTKRS